jgi:hypothetical protein
MSYSLSGLGTATPVRPGLNLARMECRNIPPDSSCYMCPPGMSISARVGMTPECVPTGSEVAITTTQSTVPSQVGSAGSSSTALWAVGAVALAAGGYWWWSHR